MSLSVQWESCVRTRSLAATCRACVDACPTNAINVDGPRSSVVVDLARCNQCGLCQAACPTEAFSGAVDVAALSSIAGATLACAEGACLAALSVEDLIGLAVRKRELHLDATRGAQCPGGAKAHQTLAQRVEEAKELIAQLGVKGRITATFAEAEPTEAKPRQPVGEGRRAFLRRLVPIPGAQPLVRLPGGILALSPRGDGQLDPKKLRGQRLPDRRERLLEALALAKQEGATGTLPSDRVSFSSNKSLNVGTCTACLQCVRACPTGAITSSRLNDELRFDASRCLKCGTCHDVCDPHALSLGAVFDAAALSNPQTRSLGRLTVKQCGECGGLFKYEGGDFLCPACSDLDDEARALHGAPPRGAA